MSADDGDLEAVIAEIGGKVESLVSTGASIGVTRDRAGEAHVDITPHRTPGAASMRILVPDTGRDMAFGAGMDFRLEGLALQDVLHSCQGVLSGGFVERVFTWRGKPVGTRGCITVEGRSIPICEAGNLGCLPPFLLRGIGAREHVVRYPPY